jgi:hypothetical protein
VSKIHCNYGVEWTTALLLRLLKERGIEVRKVGPMESHGTIAPEPPQSEDIDALTGCADDQLPGSPDDWRKVVREISVPDRREPRAKNMTRARENHAEPQTYNNLSTKAELEAAWIAQGLTLTKYHDALRLAAHHLNSDHGLVVTDKPEFLFALSGPQVMQAQHGSYWQQDHSAALKAIEDVLGYTKDVLAKM